MSQQRPRELPGLRYDPETNRYFRIPARGEGPPGRRHFEEERKRVEKKKTPVWKGRSKGILGCLRARETGQGEWFLRERIQKSFWSSSMMTLSQRDVLYNGIESPINDFTIGTEFQEASFIGHANGCLEYRSGRDGLLLRCDHLGFITSCTRMSPSSALVTRISESFMAGDMSQTATLYRSSDQGLSHILLDDPQIQGHSQWTSIPYGNGVALEWRTQGQIRSSGDILSLAVLEEREGLLLPSPILSLLTRASLSTKGTRGGLAEMGCILETMKGDLQQWDLRYPSQPFLCYHGHVNDHSVYQGLTMDPTGTILLAGGVDGKVRRWAVGDGQALGPEIALSPTGHRHPLTHLQAHPDGDGFWVSSENPGGVKRYRLSTRKEADWDRV
ncbi:hypothetical protein BJ684DRAFT_20758 [Piptocephalis cylindrospora]|uniref:WD40-repeat-containing domain protein n=1 Tax=Piptocephalis cylindrospora TaxID=1907219 RepID=A0A4P9Y4F7_9FUNG|nr:hypothetical protein BJ684DRAFT_20758 [Piptocephalis cylindrospora]|eukprot:RKP12720.1 hypothetical protein BJ684DRAFT_20758 [Piptocephalis cylindrospora]